MKVVILLSLLEIKRCRQIFILKDLALCARNAHKEN